MITEFIPLDRLEEVTIFRSSGQTPGAGQGGQPVDAIPTQIATKEHAHIIKLSGGQAEREFGKDTKARWRGLFSSDTDLQDHDLIRIDTGPYEDTIIEVNSIQNGDMLLVELGKTNRTVT